MKRVAVLLLLAMLGMTACGDEEPEQPAVEVPSADIPSWPPPLPPNALAALRAEYAALLAEATERGLSVSRAECDADWWVKEGTLRLMRGPDYDLDGLLREQGSTREDLARQVWVDLMLDKIGGQEGMSALSSLGRVALMQRIERKWRK